MDHHGHQAAQILVLKTSDSDSDDTEDESEKKPAEKKRKVANGTNSAHNGPSAENPHKKV